jgi:serine/threonine protein kinase
MKGFFEKEASDLILKLLEKNPENRIGSKKDAEDIMEHPYFEGINWDELKGKRVIPLFKPDLSDDKLKFFNPNLEKAERKPEEAKDEDDEHQPYTSIENFTYTSNSFKDRYQERDLE